MGFVALQECLRRELRRRIDAGELTGTQLARKTGFTQAHISNFINRKRGLKLVALDRMMKAVGVTVYDLLDPHDLTRHVTLPATREGDFLDIPVVDPAAAMCPTIVREQMREVLKFRRAFLERLRPSGATGRKDWTRFVALQLDAGQGAAMWPGLGGRVTVLVDRHYDCLDPYRPGRRNIYAVRNGPEVLVRYVESSDQGLVLQPRDAAFAATLLPSASAADSVVGRIVQVSLKA